ncbi:hypothetical protein BKA67DRAFT_661570 [Truncatella angustata]|uniref:Uncharacterized protein n=1 Tax=Truncatella angustata TaxID=152316 RepID=A0A9P8ZV21_9PEZI|nr:uncharacterized protein BKA67DRAFT_661570 [Truncatella angustata]KAH6648608.1 hypothetical protein BKA67DRAFT_661570 [Truncatella angustata]
MGLRQTLKRFASFRGRSRGSTPTRGEDTDAVTPINGAYQSLEEEPENSAAGDRDSDLLDPSSENLPSASQRASSAPRKYTGKRKPSNASRVRHSSGQQHRASSADPAPQDYLYFGDGGTPPGRSSTSLPSNPAQSRSSIGQTGLTVPGQSTTGRDNSGFLNAGMSNSSMSSSYSAVTYGGSLQYDYAGTQAPGSSG